jgi:hypothetical protein
MATIGDKSNIPVLMPIFEIKALAGANIGSVSSYTKRPIVLFKLIFINDIIILTRINISINLTRMLNDL